MSGTPPYSTEYTVIHLGVVRQAMVPSARRFCRTIPLAYVSVVVDAHLKWMDIYTMSSIMTEETIRNLKASFSTHALPDLLVTVNGPCFKSEGFRQFVLLNSIQHLTSPP